MTVDSDRLARIEQRLDGHDEKLDHILTFVDECSGGRKALLLLLRIMGVLVAAAAAAFAAVKALKL